MLVVKLEYIFSAFYHFFSPLPFFRLLPFFPPFTLFSAFPPFTLFSAFYPFFRFSAFYPFFRLLPFFPLFRFRFSVSAFYPYPLISHIQTTLVFYFRHIFLSVNEKIVIFLTNISFTYCTR